MIRLSTVVSLGLLAVAGPVFAQWSELRPPNSPTWRSDSPLVYDAARDEIVLFGGRQCTPGCDTYLGDTWVWNGVTWTQKLPAHSPSPRAVHSMIYDPVRREVVLFGGLNPYAYPEYHADTWVWNGEDWTQRSPVHSPTKRCAGVFAFDPVRAEAVLYGGGDWPPNRILTDTWTWNGTDWTPKNPVTSPSERVEQAAAFDAARGVLVMFGGRRGEGAAVSNAETWTWDGVNWTQLSPPASPSPRFRHAMAYDPVAREVLLFAGDAGWYNYVDDTWTWNGSTWTRKFPPVSPAVRNLHNMVFSPRNGGILLFGGHYWVNGDSHPLGDTWLWQSPDSTPPVITPTVTGTQGKNGWYTSGVTVNWTVTDPESGIASSTGCGSATLSADTPGTTLTCTATNGVGLTASQTVTIRIDRTPPQIQGLPAPDCTLWPPNGKLVQVAVVTAGDSLSGLLPFSLLVTGASNEPADPKEPDIVITPRSSGGFVVELRAKRLGGGTSRIYTLTAAAEDLAGNRASATAQCRVPHSQGN